MLSHDSGQGYLRVYVQVCPRAQAQLHVSLTYFQDLSALRAAQPLGLSTPTTRTPALLPARLSAPASRAADAQVYRAACAPFILSSAAASPPPPSISRVASYSSEIEFYVGRLDTRGSCEPDTCASRFGKTAFALTLLQLHLPGIQRAMQNTAIIQLRVHSILRQLRRPRRETSKVGRRALGVAGHHPRFWFAAGFEKTLKSSFMSYLSTLLSNKTVTGNYAPTCTLLANQNKTFSWVSPELN